MLITSSALRAAYDCFVIGSGPAGMTLAVELSRQNKSVLVFESGTATGETAEGMTTPNAVNHGHFRDGWWNRHSVRALGGTSKIWTGQCATLTKRDFDNPAAGIRWPITKSALVPYYARAAAILDRNASIVDAQSPLTPRFVYRPFSRAGYPPAPIRFGVKYFDLLRQSQRIHVALESSVTGLDANASRSAVLGLTYSHRPSGITQRLDINSSQDVVLAGGGIGNAQLLLQPRQDGAVPVGNESGHAGKFLMEHPILVRVAEVVLDEDLDRQALPEDFGSVTHALVANDEEMLRHGLLGCSVDCFDKTTDHPMVKYLSDQYRKPFYHYTSTLRSEMLPSATNRVFLTREQTAAGLRRLGVRCVIGSADFINAERTLHLLGKSLIESNKGRVRVHNARLYREPPTGGGHIMGTTRMGTRRSNSVVDADCRVHGYRNLFVAGSSVFPTGGYANPTLTIVALSVRLADALAATR